MVLPDIKSQGSLYDYTTKCEDRHACLVKRHGAAGEACSMPEISRPLLLLGRVNRTTEACAAAGALVRVG